VERVISGFPPSGVAFDCSLSRLGHGKGYYDRFISSYIASGRNKPLLGTFKLTNLVTLFIYLFIYLLWGEIVGLALREQLQATPIPIDESDWKLDMLVTPDEIIGGVE
jgi:5-formyltetrahydrofolate cyclo-ligase